MLYNSIAIDLTCHNRNVGTVDDLTGPSKLFDWMSAVIILFYADFNKSFFLLFLTLFFSSNDNTVSTTSFWYAISCSLNRSRTCFFSMFFLCQTIYNFLCINLSRAFSCNICLIFFWHAWHAWHANNDKWRIQTTASKYHHQ